MDDGARPPASSGAEAAGTLVRALDWRGTVLGDREGWPQPLTALVRIMLGSGQPMFVAWGPDRTLLYNDAYATMLGARHPAAFGRPFFAVWPEVRAAVGALMDRVFAGEPIHMDDLELTSNRNGYPEERHFSFSYTPVPDDHGGIVGLFCACTETTLQVLAERRADAERARQRHLLQQMPGFVGLLAGPDHVFEYVNDAYVAISGPRVFVGRTVRAVFPELADQGFYELLDRVYASGEAFEARAMPIHLAGEAENHFIDLLYQPIRDDDGIVTGIFVGGYDITERVRADAALRRTERRQAFLLDLGDHLREHSDPRATMQAAVDAIGRHLGVSRVGYGLVHSDGLAVDLETEYLDGVGPLVGTYPLTAFGPGNIANLRIGLTSVYPDVEADPGTAGIGLGRHEIAAILAVPLVREGRFRAVVYLNHRVPRPWAPDEVGLVEEVATRIWDAVERARAQDALRAINEDLEAQVAERTRRLRANFETSFVFQAYLEPDGTLLDVNAAALAAIARGLEDVRGLPFWATPWFSDTPDAPETVRESVERGAAGGTSFVSFVLDLPTGRRAFDVSMRPVLDEAGTVVGLLSEAVETTGRLAAEDALRQAQKMEAVGQLTGGVAHDFNNLLTVIKSSTDLLKRPDLPEDRRQRYIGAIADTVDRAAKLTSQLLAFARRQALKPEVFDVGRSVASVADMVGTLTGSRIRVVTTLAETACFIDADPSQFDTAIVNMAVNARDAMDGQGTLAVSVSAASRVPAMRAHPARDGDFVAVSIADTGAGIAPGDVARIFEPFFTTKGVGQGTGLGLSQVFGFAKQSGGEIDVASEPGVGTTFTLYLPRVAGKAVSEDALPEPEPLVDGHGTRVLVVEDNIEVGTFATQTLAELGYTTVWATNAEAALAELGRDPGRFDVVFSDVVMPGMNGIDLAHEIRRRHHDLPVLLASGYSHVLAQNGTYGFELLHKPYSVEQLSRTLRKVATRRRVRPVQPA